MESKLLQKFPYKSQVRFSKEWLMRYFSGNAFSLVFRKCDGCIYMFSSQCRTFSFIYYDCPMRKREKKKRFLSLSKSIPPSAYKSPFLPACRLDQVLVFSFCFTVSWEGNIHHPPSFHPPFLPSFHPSHSLPGLTHLPPSLVWDSGQVVVWVVVRRKEEEKKRLGERDVVWRGRERWERKERK